MSKYSDRINLDRSDKSCGCRDFEFCGNCADPIEQKEIDNVDAMYGQVTDSPDSSMEESIEILADNANRVIVPWLTAYHNIWKKSPTATEYQHYFYTYADQIWPRDNYDTMDFRFGNN